MCLNGFGFNESRLYLYSQYFENHPTERLSGDGVLPEHLNDDALRNALIESMNTVALEFFVRV